MIAISPEEGEGSPAPLSPSALELMLEMEMSLLPSCPASPVSTTDSSDSSECQEPGAAILPASSIKEVDAWAEFIHSSSIRLEGFCQLISCDKVCDSEQREAGVEWKERVQSAEDTVETAFNSGGEEVNDLASSQNGGRGEPNSRQRRQGSKWEEPLVSKLSVVNSGEGLGQGVVVADSLHNICSEEEKLTVCASLFAPQNFETHLNFEDSFRPEACIDVPAESLSSSVGGSAYSAGPCSSPDGLQAFITGGRGQVVDLPPLLHFDDPELLTLAPAENVEGVIRQAALSIAEKESRKRRVCAEQRLSEEVTGSSGGRLQAWWRAARVRLHTGPRLAAARNVRKELALDRCRMGDEDELSHRLREQLMSQIIARRQAEAAERRRMDSEEPQSRALQRQRAIEDRIGEMEVEIRRTAEEQIAKALAESQLMQMADKFSSMLRRVHFLEEAELKEMAKVDRESARVRSMLQSDAVNELREVDLMAAADVASENMNLALRNEFSTLTPLQLRCRYEGRRQSASIVIAEGKGNYQPAQRSLRNPLCCNTPILLQADDVSLLLGRSRTKLGVELRRCAPVGLKASPLRPSAREQVGKLSCTSQDHPLTADMISHLGPLSSLKSLEVCVEGLTRVCVLQQAPALTSLSLNVNCICSLEGLASCKNLRELSLSDNCLASLVGLGELEKLQELRVDVNSLTSLDGLESMPSLTELSAGTNRIASLPKGLALPRLQKLSLYHNRISSLPVPALSHMRQLMQLDLGRNNLREIHGSALSACPSLVRLVLSQNRLHTVPAPLCLPLLRELWLSGNSLTSLAEWNNEGLLFVPSLISLHVDDNQLAFLGGSMTLVGAPLLRDLNLSFNSLEDTNEGVESALVPCTRLRHLQLHDNPLAEAHCYPQKVIGGCPGLWTLDGESIRPADMHSAALSISGGSSHIVMPWLLALRSSGLPAVSRRGTSSPFCWTSARRWAWARHGSARLRHRGSSLAAGELRDLSCGYEVTCAGGGVGLALLQGQQRREEASLNVRREEVPDGQADLKLQHASERVALVQQLFRQMYGYDNVALPPVTSRLVYHESLKEKACQKIKIWFRDAMARKKDAMLPQGTSTAVISLQSAFRGFHVRKALRAALESARYIDEELEGMALEDPFDVEAFLGASPAQLSAGWDCEAPQLRRPEPAAPAWGATPQSQGKHATHACKGSSESHAPPPASAAESQLVDDWGLSDPRVLLARRRRLRKLERNVELRAKRADPYYRLRKFERNAGMR